MKQLNSRVLSPAGGAISEEPRFVEPIQNVTIASGRDVKLSCVVDNLGTYKVSFLVQQFLSSFLLVSSRKFSWSFPHAFPRGKTHSTLMINY